MTNAFNVSLALAKSEIFKIFKFFWERDRGEVTGFLSAAAPRFLERSLKPLL